VSHCKPDFEAGRLILCIDSGESTRARSHKGVIPDHFRDSFPCRHPSFEAGIIFRLFQGLDPFNDSGTGNDGNEGEEDSHAAKGEEFSMADTGPGEKGYAHYGEPEEEPDPSSPGESKNQGQKKNSGGEDDQAFLGSTESV